MVSSTPAIDLESFADTDNSTPTDSDHSLRTSIGQHRNHSRESGRLFKRGAKITWMSHSSRISWWSYSIRQGRRPIVKVDVIELNQSAWSDMQLADQLTVQSLMRHTRTRTQQHQCEELAIFLSHKAMGWAKSPLSAYRSESRL